MLETQTLVERTVGGLHESLLEYLPKELSIDSRIIDIGCGTGAWLHRLHEAGFHELTGIDVDVSQVATEFCKCVAVNVDDVKWANGLGEFELVTAIEVIEHVENIGVFLDNLANLVCDSGTIILTTPNLHSFATRIRFLLNGSLRHFDDLSDPTHIYPVFLPNLRKLIASHGLEICNIWGYPCSGEILGARPFFRFIYMLANKMVRQEVAGDILCVKLRKSLPA